MCVCVHATILEQLLGEGIQVKCGNAGITQYQQHFTDICIERDFIFFYKVFDKAMSVPLAYLEA